MVTPAGSAREREGVVEILGHLRVDGEGVEVAQVDPVGVGQLVQRRLPCRLRQDRLAEAPPDTAVREQGLHHVLEHAALAEGPDDLGLEPVGEREENEIPGLRLDRAALHRQRRTGLEQRLHLQALAPADDDPRDGGRPPGGIARRDQTGSDQGRSAALGAATSFVVPRHDVSYPAG